MRAIRCIHVQGNYDEVAEALSAEGYRWSSGDPLSRKLVESKERVLWLYSNFRVAHGSLEHYNRAKEVAGYPELEVFNAKGIPFKNVR